MELLDQFAINETNLEGLKGMLISRAQVGQDRVFEVLMNVPDKHIASPIYENVIIDTVEYHSRTSKAVGSNQRWNDDLIRIGLPKVCMNHLFSCTPVFDEIKVNLTRSENYYWTYIQLNELVVADIEGTNIKNGKGAMWKQFAQFLDAHPELKTSERLKGTAHVDIYFSYQKGNKNDENGFLDFKMKGFCGTSRVSTMETFEYQTPLKDPLLDVNLIYYKRTLYLGSNVTPDTVAQAYLRVAPELPPLAKVEVAGVQGYAPGGGGCCTIS